MVDLSIANVGEVASPLTRLLQEIDIIMTSANESIITNYQPGKGLDRFLFKTSVNGDYVARQVKELIIANIDTELDYDIDVNVQFIRGRHDKDIMYVNIIVDASGANEQLQYAIS